MQIGFNAPTSGALIEPDSLRRIITEGEALGFDYTTVSDHIMVPRNLESKYPYTDTRRIPGRHAAAWLEQLTTTAFIAALTSKLRFVLSVMVVPHRPAVLTAKMLATIDYLSKGRLTLGIGVGWCREEFEAIGAAPFDDRGHVTDEWMMACKELWTQRRATLRRQVCEVLRRGVHAEAGAAADPDLGRRRERAGAATHGALCRLLVSGRHQSAIPDEHARSLQGRHGAVPWLGREGRTRSSEHRGGVACSRPDLLPRSRRTIDGEAEMFTGGAADYVGDISALAELGVSAVDVRLFAPTLDATIDNMRRFRDEVMAKVR